MLNVKEEMMFNELRNELLESKILDNSKLEISIYEDDDNINVMIIDYDDLHLLVDIKDDKYYYSLSTRENFYELHLMKNIILEDYSDDVEEIRFTLFMNNFLSKVYKEFRNEKSFKLLELDDLYMTFTLEDKIKVNVFISYEDVNTTITNLKNDNVIMNDEILYHDEIKEVIENVLKEL